jgi:hypothetical protein
MSFQSFLRLSTVMAFSAACASASPAWTTGSTTGSGGFSPASGNLILGELPSAVSNGSAGAENTGGTDRLTDGLYAAGNGERYVMGSWGSLVYEFESASLVSGIHFYSQWNDTGRDRITIASIQAKDSNDEWQTIPNSAVNYDDGSFNCFAKFADTNGAPLVAATTGIKINFGEQGNGYVGYVEIEIIGRLSTVLELRNPITGSNEVTGTNAVEVALMPVVDNATQYQITVGEAAPSAGAWLAYTPGMIPAGAIDFAAPPTNGNVSLTAWFRTGPDDDDPLPCPGSIYYTTESPTLVLRDITLMLGKSGTRELTPFALDAGSSDPYGIVSLSVSPASVSSVGTVEATVRAVNAAGNVSTATAEVAVIPFAESGIGTGDAADPLPHGYFTRLLHLGTNFNDEWIASSATGGVDGDQLSAFGGQANQHPFDGLVYEGVFGANTLDGNLAWTLMDCPDPGGRWEPSPNREDYIKYWHIYINLPGKDERTVYFRHYNDDGLRVWNNGVLMVSHGGAGGEYATEGTLFPGMNSLTIKLQEGGGGDYMQLRITDANGNSFNDLTCQFTPYSFQLVDPVTGSRDYTSSNTLRVNGLPTLDDFAEYQITASEDASSLDDSGWGFYDYLNPPRNVTFPLPAAAPCEVTNVLWLRAMDAGVLATNKHVDTITYSTEAPTAVATNISIPIDTCEGTPITPAMIDNGSTGGESGIYTMTVTPPRITAPGNVTLTVTNNAGLAHSATVAVSASRWSDVYVSADGNDATGTGRPEYPWRTITRALAEVNDPGGTVYVDAGTYSAACGELFPLVVKSGVRVVGWAASGTPDRAGRVVDGGNTASSLFCFTNGVGNCVVRGLHLCDTTAGIAFVDASEATFEDVLFTQSSADFGSVGAIQIANSGTANASGCDFLGMQRIGAVWCSQDHYGYFNATNCLFSGNVNAYAAIAAPSGASFHINVDDSTFATNSGLNQKLHDGQAAACVYFWGAWGRNGSARLDHCRFLGNTGRALISASSAGINVRDSLFADNPVTHHIFNGYSTTFLVDNCTFVRCGGGFNGYVSDTYLRNCILCQAGVLTRSSSDMNDDPTRLRLQHVVLWETDTGLGYNEPGSHHVVVGNPWLENPGVAWDDPAFDAAPRPYSPAIDAGANSVAFNRHDLAGNPRVASNDGDDTATVDLGCFESLFHASPTPVFQIPAPGALYIFKGGTFTTPVSISPAADGPVTAAIAYGEGLAGPATLSFPDGAGPVDLTVGVDSDCTNRISRLVLSESGTSEGVGSSAVDVFPASNVVTLGGVTNFFLRDGATRNFTVSLAEQGLVASAQLPIVVNGPFGAGSNLAEWSGDAFIDVGEAGSSGHLAVTGGGGANTIEVAIGGGFVFAESGSDTVVLTVIGYPGHLYVDPETGVDTATGTLADPLRTVTFAIGELVAGDEVRLLPGEYTAAQETFPFMLAGISLAGCTAAGEPVATAGDCIVTGGDTADILAKVSGTDPVTIANLTLRESSGVALFVASTPTAVTNVVFTQTVQNKGVAGAIQLRDNASVTATGCVFTNMTRFGVVFMEHYVLNNQHVFTAKRCLFADNDSECATIAGGMNVNLYVTLEDCTFRNNAVTPSDSQYSDSYRGQVLFGRNGPSLVARRCRFLGGSEGAVFGINYFNNNNGAPATCVIDDCLFAGNDAPAGVFHGYASWPHVRNCTFVGNTGGYNGRNIHPTFYNSIIRDGTLSFVPPDGQMDIQPGTELFLNDTLLWNVEEGRGYATNSSANVMLADPALKNVAVAWDDPAFNARPSSASPAIDAGNNAHGCSELDLDGNPRLWIGRAGAGEAVVDLGCYESGTIRVGTLLLMR